MTTRCCDVSTWPDDEPLCSSIAKLDLIGEARTMEDIIGGILLGALTPFAVGYMAIGPSPMLVLVSLACGAVIGFLCSKKTQTDK